MHYRGGGGGGLAGWRADRLAGGPTDIVLLQFWCLRVKLGGAIDSRKPSWVEDTGIALSLVRSLVLVAVGDKVVEAGLNLS